MSALAVDHCNAHPLQPDRLEKAPRKRERSPGTAIAPSESRLRRPRPPPTLASASILSCLSSVSAAEDRARTSREPIGANVAADSPSALFGLKSELAVSSDAGLSISNTSISGTDGSTTTLQLRPAIDYFVIDDLSIGGFVSVDYAHNPGSHTTTFSIGPRVGYNIPLSEKFTVWPKVGFSYSSTSSSVEQASLPVPGGAVQTLTTSSSSISLALNVFVPFMFHPVQHFFLGFGPALDVDLTGDVKATTVAGRLTIGGWI